MSFKSLKMQSGNPRSVKERNRKLEPVARHCDAESLDNSVGRWAVDRFCQTPLNIAYLVSSCDSAWLPTSPEPVEDLFDCSLGQSWVYLMLLMNQGLTNTCLNPNTNPTPWVCLLDLIIKPIRILLRMTIRCPS